MEGRLRHLAVEALFPRFCVRCSREGELLCGLCIETWTPVPKPASCGFCGRGGSVRTCFDCSGEVYLDGVSSAIPYANPVVRKLLQKWKYHGDRQAGDGLKRIVRASASTMEPPLNPWLACPVPLHQSRRRARGFDQAYEVACWAGEMFGLPVARPLVRTRATSPRARVSHDARRVGELDGAFAVRRDMHAPEHVLLCDDVFTSGATIDAAARALKEAGTKTVWGFVIARGGYS